MIRGISILIVAASLAGCSTNDASPLIFGQGVTVGISAGSAPEAGGTPQITVGVKQADIAIVPTVVPKEIPVDATDDRRIAAFGKQQANGKEGKQDALSTFGSFSTTTSAGQGAAAVELGIFFATGVAAQTLSEGFRCALANTKDMKACTITISDAAPASGGG